MRVLVITWGPGGNLPPMLAAASLLDLGLHRATDVAGGYRALREGGVLADLT